MVRVRSFVFLAVAYLAMVGAASGAPIPTPATPHPAVVPIPLEPLIAKAGPVLALPASPAGYSLSGPCNLLKQIHLIAPRGTLLTTPSQYTCFTASHACIVIDGFSCHGAATFMHVKTGSDDCELLNCDLTGVLKAFDIDPGAKNFKAENIVVQSSSVSCFGTSAFALINPIIATPNERAASHSVGEYVIRWEGGDDGFLVIGGEYSNRGNAYGKDTIGDRFGSGRITGAIIHGNIRIGQSNQIPVPAPGAWATLQIDHCTFLDQSPGHCYVEVLQGADVYEFANTFGPAHNPNFAVTPAGGGMLHHGIPRPTPATKPSK